MPAHVTNPRAADELRREYGVMGERLNLRIDDVVVPVAIVSDLTAGSGGVPLVRRAYGKFYQGAVALEYCTWRLEVPPGIMGIVRRLYVRGPAAGSGRLHFGTSLAVTPPNLAPSLQYMDGRLREEQGLFPAGRLAYGTQVAGLAAPYMDLQIDAVPGFQNLVEWPFGRNDGMYDFIEMQAATVNGAIDVTMEWDEVQLM